MNFKVSLDVFAGPLDLLLYLVKKHEVDVTEVPPGAYKLRMSVNTGRTIEH
jgi:hypothetical protein